TGIRCHSARNRALPSVQIASPPSFLLDNLPLLGTMNGITSQYVRDGVSYYGRSSLRAFARTEFGASAGCLLGSCGTVKAVPEASGGENSGGANCRQDGSVEHRATGTFGGMPTSRSNSGPRQDGMAELVGKHRPQRSAGPVALLSPRQTRHRS